MVLWTWARFYHGLLARLLIGHWHRRWLELLGSTLMLLLKWWLSTGHRHHRRASWHRHLKITSLRWRLIVHVLLHILWLLLLWVSLIIASTTAHVVVVVVILVLTHLVVIIVAAVILPWLLRLILLHHGLIVGSVSPTTHRSSIHHSLRWWHIVHWVGPIVVHRGRLLLCSRGFELLDAARHLEGRLKVCYRWVQGSSVRRCLVATKNTQKQAIEY